MSVVAKSIECRALSSSGDRCKRRTVKYGPNCWQHTKILDGVEVKKSKIKLPNGKRMMGLFAMRSFKPKQAIVEYTGEKLSQNDLDTRYPGDTIASYTVKRTDTSYIDARKTNSGVARYSNDCENVANPNIQKKKCNADMALVKIPRSGKRARRGVVLRAITKIKKGDEILNSYGDQYWDHGRENMSDKLLKKRHKITHKSIRGLSHINKRV
jgi:SET domain-containing protein